MVDFYLTVLGANSAIPIAGRFSSSFVLQHDQRAILIDCGEGAQVKMSEFGIKRSKITHVFISHLHGDHIFGLPGFLTSLILNGRKEKLTIVGPTGIKSFIQHLPYVLGDHMTFEIDFLELAEGGIYNIDISDRLVAKAFPLEHRIPTFGYRFDERDSQHNIDPSVISKYDLTIDEIKRIKAGITIMRDELKVPLRELVLPPRPPRSFAYCSDTAYKPSIVDHVTGCTLLYHEATYTRDLQDKATQYAHSTAEEAAMIAAKANVNQLLIGHYSSRYKDLSPLLEEAREVFPHTLMAEEGLRVTM